MKKPSLQFDLKLFTLGLLGIGLAVVAYLEHKADHEMLLAQESRLVHLERQFLESTEKQKRSLSLSGQAVQKSNSRTVALKYLHTLNFTKDLQAKKKKVLLLEDRIIIQDLSVLETDAFYELLAYLFDEDQIQSVLIPKKNLRSIRSELMEFGVPREMIKVAPNQELVFIIRPFI